MKRIILLLAVFLFVGCEKESKEETIDTVVIIYCSKGQWIELNSQELGLMRIYKSDDVPNVTTGNRFNTFGQTVFRFEGLPPKTIYGTYKTALDYTGNWKLTPIVGETLILDAYYCPGWN